MASSAEASACDIAVVVVAYRSESWLERCLASVYCEGSHISLLDNGGMNQSTVDVITRRFPGLSFVPYQSNMGFVGGNNHLIAHFVSSDAKIIFLLNPDAWMEPNWVVQIRELFSTFPDYGVLAPLQLTYEDGFELAEWTKKMLSVLSADQVSCFMEPIDVPWVEGSALFIRREVIDQLGLFDPVFDMYFEEVDLCRRVRRAGWKVGIVPSIRYHHAVGTSLGGKDSPARQMRKDLGQVLYVMTDPGRSRFRNGIELVRLLARRAVLWARGGYPLFPQLIVQGAKDLFRKRRLISEKWHRERRIQPHLESR